MKRLFIFVNIIAFQVCFAQVGNYSSSIYRISYFGNYQTWSTPGDSSLSQFSNQLNIKYKAERNTTISLNSWFASSKVESQNLSGISDIQLRVDHKLKKYNTQFEFGINLPTGDESLSSAEFSSAILLSRDIFSFNLPILGQGTNIFFGATWANEVSDKVVMGFGLSYQLRGGYSPLAELSSKYEPSNELVVTSGIDYKIDKNKSISGDILTLFYGKDKVDGNEVFSAGNRFVFNVSYRQFIANNILSFNVRYRYSVDDEVKNQLVFISQKVNPNYFIVSTTFLHKLSIDFALQYLLEARFFEETASPFSGFSTYGLGTRASYRVSPKVEIPFRLKFLFGSQSDESLTGFELGAGVNIAI